VKKERKKGRFNRDFVEFTILVEEMPPAKLLSSQIV
jgi:hypothetical protein